MFTIATRPGGDAPNEDWAATTPDMVVVLDGATTRTDTGCSHGVPWYVRHLGTALLTLAADVELSLPAALAGAIDLVTTLHPRCDLTHPGTPSAAVGVVRWRSPDAIDLLALGDVSIVLDRADSGVQVVSDNRVSQTALQLRQAADEHPIGSPGKKAALVEMKHAELDARNVPGGYWIAATDPTAAEHAVHGVTAAGDIRRFAVLTDGAARYAEMFHPGEWEAVLRILHGSGPDSLIDLVRSMERCDPAGRRCPRNKMSDDATAVYWRPTPVPHVVTPVPYPELTAVPAGLMGAAPPFPDRHSIPVPRTE